jgi:N-acetylglutamate synthase
MPAKPPARSTKGKPREPDASASAAGTAAGTADASLKRERAGTYRTKDGRFTVEQSSSGWLVLDSEQADDLGLPLARGPFATLDGAKAAIAEARSSAAPRSDLRAPRDRAPAKRAGDADADRPRGSAAKSSAGAGAARPARRAPKRPDPEAVVIRELRAVDGDALRTLWQSCGFRALGDDDLGLARYARRNPGLALVASESGRVIGSALGAWDGRRASIYHVAVAESHRRRGIATQLVDKVEAGLRDLGSPEVRINVGEDNRAGRAFWTARGYELRPVRQLAKQLRSG